MPPRGLDPRGIILVDKPAGPTSFDIVAAVRRRTGARTGHAGTLDPFATGLLLLLSGAATSLQSRFVGLDKRYVTEIDLSARTSTGDPEGEVLAEHREQAPAGCDVDDVLLTVHVERDRHPASSTGAANGSSTTLGSCRGPSSSPSSRSRSSPRAAAAPTPRRRRPRRR